MSNKSVMPTMRKMHSLTMLATFELWYTLGHFLLSSAYDCLLASRCRQLRFAQSIYTGIGMSLLRLVLSTTQGTFLVKRESQSLV